jgi:hypothetical protein
MDCEARLTERDKLEHTASTRPEAAGSTTLSFDGTQVGSRGPREPC